MNDTEIEERLLELEVKEMIAERKQCIRNEVMKLITDYQGKEIRKKEAECQDLERGNAWMTKELDDKRQNIAIAEKVRNTLIKSNIMLADYIDLLEEEHKRDIQGVEEFRSHCSQILEQRREELMKCHRNWEAQISRIQELDEKKRENNLMQVQLEQLQSNLRAVRQEMERKASMLKEKEEMDGVKIIVRIAKLKRDADNKALSTATVMQEVRKLKMIENERTRSAVIRNSVNRYEPSHCQSDAVNFLGESLVPFHDNRRPEPLLTSCTPNHLLENTGLPQTRHNKPIVSRYFDRFQPYGASDQNDDKVQRSSLIRKLPTMVDKMGFGTATHLSMNVTSKWNALQINNTEFERNPKFLLQAKPSRTKDNSGGAEAMYCLQHKAMEGNGLQQDKDTADQNKCVRSFQEQFEPAVRNALVKHFTQETDQLSKEQFPYASMLNETTFEASYTSDLDKSLLQGELRKTEAQSQTQNNPMLMESTTGFGGQDFNRGKLSIVGSRPFTNFTFGIPGDYFNERQKQRPSVALESEFFHRPLAITPPFQATPSSSHNANAIQSSSNDQVQPTSAKRQPMTQHDSQEGALLSINQSYCQSSPKQSSADPHGREMEDTLVTKSTPGISVDEEGRSQYSSGQAPPCNAMATARYGSGDSCSARLPNESQQNATALKMSSDMMLHKSSGQVSAVMQNMEVEVHQELVPHSVSSETSATELLKEFNLDGLFMENPEPPKKADPGPFRKSVFPFDDDESEESSRPASQGTFCFSFGNSRRQQSVEQHDGFTFGSKSRKTESKGMDFMIHFGQKSSPDSPTSKFFLS